MLSTARQFNRTFHLLQALRGLSSSYILATNSDSLHDRGISSQGTTYAAYLWAQNISERKKKGTGWVERVGRRTVQATVHRNVGFRLQ